MRECMHRCRIGEIVRRHIHRLNGGDRTRVGVGDALLQLRQFGAHGRLITQARRHLPHQTRHFHAGLDETENIIDQQQHIPMLVIAKILCHCQRCMADAETGAGRFVHLAEHHHHILQHTRRFHIPIELFSLATAFPDAAKDAHPLMMPDHVVYHLGEQHGLAYPCPTEQSCLAATLQRGEHIDDLDAGFKYFGLGRTPRQGRRCAMHTAPFDIRRRRQAIDGIAKNVEHAREGCTADRHFQRATGIKHCHAASQPLRRGQRDTAHPMRVQLSQDLDGDITRMQQRIDRRQITLEADIHNTAAHRDQLAGIQRTCIHSPASVLQQSTAYTDRAHCVAPRQNCPSTVKARPARGAA